MNVVITGGCGFIGSNLAHELVEVDEVTVIDDLSTGRPENNEDLLDNENYRYVEGSITDLNLLKQVFDGVDYVFHQAAIPSVPRSIKDPAKTNEVNISGTLNVLIAADQEGVKKVVYASSSSVYGETPVLPKEEGMIPDPLSPYAVSKLAGEYYCKVFAEIYGLKTASLRYFNVYGPKQDPSSEYAAVIPKFITRVLNGKPPVICGDGEQTRDFTFVKDVVSANILAAGSSKTGVFNIGSGARVSVNELAAAVIEASATGTDPGILHAEPRDGDVRHSLADISRAKSIGYEPSYALTDGLEETIRSFSV
ncbi:MAG: GDP-mannose 4,6-dehydratase [Candidatus Methanogaster sp.]|uniref:GDP-mannose 4,6-dehydratase n=1 Tax=Candidatus Methanogaster sp. TaxID=3386292 RepID=A0AC61L759_9EURY|nr:MAG: GDP-mannose 4,6-dehydratase [ANME-2 cluster archaeon]